MTLQKYNGDPQKILHLAHLHATHEKKTKTKRADLPDTVSLTSGLAPLSLIAITRENRLAYF